MLVPIGEGEEEGRGGIVCGREGESSSGSEVGDRVVVGVRLGVMRIRAVFV